AFLQPDEEVVHIDIVIEHRDSFRSGPTAGKQRPACIQGGSACGQRPFCLSRFSTLSTPPEKLSDRGNMEGSTTSMARWWCIESGRTVVETSAASGWQYTLGHRSARLSWSPYAPPLCLRPRLNASQTDAVPRVGAGWPTRNRLLLSQ